MYTNIYKFHKLKVLRETTIFILVARLKVSFFFTLIHIFQFLS